jgi:hypothetical protein
MQSPWNRASQKVALPDQKSTNIQHSLPSPVAAGGSSCQTTHVAVQDNLERRAGPALATLILTLANKV